MTDQSPDDQALAEVMEGNPGADDLADAPGLIGVRDTRSLGDYAVLLADIGRSSHSPFGDRLVVLAGRLLDFAHEARRRLVDDQLPSGAGSDEQRDRIAEEHERRRRAAAESAAPEQPTLTGFVDETLG